MLKYLDTCTPDYFQGFSGLHVYAVPLDASDTYRSVYDALAELIAHEEIEGFDGNYSAIENDLSGLRHVAGELGYLDSAFLDSAFLDPLDGDHDFGEEIIYAYFGVLEE